MDMSSALGRVNLEIYRDGGGNIDQNEPLRLGPSTFGLKLMDHGDFKVLKMC